MHALTNCARGEATRGVCRCKVDVAMHRAHVAGSRVGLSALNDHQGMQVGLLNLPVIKAEGLQCQQQYVVSAAAIPALRA